MSPGAFRTSIRHAIAATRDAEVWAATVYEIPLPRSEDFNRVSMDTMEYEQVYNSGLSLSHYNLLLTDLAFFQFTMASDTEYALAYYPNPRLSGSPKAIDQFRRLERERDECLLASEEFDLLASTMPVLAYIPRIRFEFSEQQYRPVIHPGAHFHIGMSGEDRWCCTRMISPHTFCLLILKHYYPDSWWPRSRFGSMAETQLADPTCVDARLLNALRDDGVSHCLTEHESLSFHFSAFMAA